MPKLNLTADEIKDAQGGPIPPLPAGVYGALIYTSEQKTSKQGNEMYQIDFKITEGPVVPKKRTIRGWFVQSGPGLFKLIELNKATGFPYPTKDTPAGEFDLPEADEYLGIQVNIKLGQEPYETVDDEGNDITAIRNRLDKVLPYDPDKIDSEGDEDAPAASGGMFLK